MQDPFWHPADMLSAEMRVIETLVLQAEKAIRECDFQTALDKQAELASGSDMSQLFAEVVGGFIASAREKPNAAVDDLRRIWA
jgi:hypothetical protein